MKLFINTTESGSAFLYFDEDTGNIEVSGSKLLEVAAFQTTDVLNGLRQIKCLSKANPNDCDQTAGEFIQLPSSSFTREPGLIEIFQEYRVDDTDIVGDAICRYGVRYTLNAITLAQVWFELVLTGQRTNESQVIVEPVFRTIGDQRLFS